MQVSSPVPCACDSTSSPPPDKGGWGVISPQVDMQGSLPRTGRMRGEDRRGGELLPRLSIPIALLDPSTRFDLSTSSGHRKLTNLTQDTNTGERDRRARKRRPRSPDELPDCRVMPNLATSPLNIRYAMTREESRSDVEPVRGRVRSMTDYTGRLWGRLLLAAVGLICALGWAAVAEAQNPFGNLRIQDRTPGRSGNTNFSYSPGCCADGRTHTATVPFTVTAVQLRATSGNQIHWRSVSDHTGVSDWDRWPGGNAFTTWRSVEKDVNLVVGTQEFQFRA